MHDTHRSPSLSGIACHLPARLLAARAGKGISPDELDDIAKVCRGTISRWESGHVGDADSKALSAVARALGVSVTWLLGDGVAQNETSEDAVIKELLRVWGRLTLSQRRELVQQAQRIALSNMEVLGRFAASSLPHET